MSCCKDGLCYKYHLKSLQWSPFCILSKSYSHTSINKPLWSRTATDDAVIRRHTEPLNEFEMRFWATQHSLTLVVLRGDTICTCIYLKAGNVAHNYPCLQACYHLCMIMDICEWWQKGESETERKIQAGKQTERGVVCPCAHTCTVCLLIQFSFFGVQS